MLKLDEGDRCLLGATASAGARLEVVPQTPFLSPAIGAGETSTRLFKSYVDEGLRRLYVRSDGSLAWVETDHGFAMAMISDLSDRGKRIIGVLPPVDSMDGIVRALKDLVERIEASPTLSEAIKRQRGTALRTLIGDLRQAGAQVGVQELLRALAQGMSG